MGTGAAKAARGGARKWEVAFMRTRCALPGRCAAPGLFAILFLTVSCYPSNVIDEQSRQVVIDLPAVEWTAAPDEFPAGLYQSEEITGEAAGALVRLYYYFGTNHELANAGNYSGAALVLASGGPSFQVLEGAWVYGDGRLDLGDGSGPLVVETATDRLRLTSESGGVVFVRQELH